jgi:hypothetical protein
MSSRKPSWTQQRATLEARVKKAESHEADAQRAAQLAKAELGGARFDLEKLRATAARYGHDSATLLARCERLENEVEWLRDVVTVALGRADKCETRN